MLAVVKADAYGHGMVPVARALSEEGVRAFGVAVVSEGIRLRQEGIPGQIVVFLGADRGEVAEVIYHRLEPVVFDRNRLALLAAEAAGMGKEIGVHLKVDTGMGRLGVLPGEVAEFVRMIKGLPGVFLAGVMSHFPKADNPEGDQTVSQNRLFGKLLEPAAGPAGRAPAHIANSAAVIRYPDMHWDMVRPGISLYGCYPFAGPGERELVTLRQVMSFKSRVIQVKDVEKGFGVSYDHTFVTSRASRLAVLPVGYQDGYLRAISNRAEVLVRGRRAPQRGRITMNVCVIDVTDIPGVAAGDEVVIMGRQGDEEITADEMAAWMGTINYEVLCLFGRGKERIYIP